MIHDFANHHPVIAGVVFLAFVVGMLIAFGSIDPKDDSPYWDGH